MARRWVPDNRWEGEDAYVIGGGPSLRSFDWDLVRGRRTIGCNSAFVLGASVVEALLFADYDWWRAIGRERLGEFGGLVVGCCPRLDEDWRGEHSAEAAVLPSWLLLAERENDRNGLSVGSKIHFNGNCGAMAIHLALALGARRVHLLGYDMMFGEGRRVNWHDVRCEEQIGDPYPTFARSFETIARDLWKYPGSEVVNVSDNTGLRAFPIVSPAEHFGKRARARR